MELPGVIKKLPCLSVWFGGRLLASVPPLSVISSAIVFELPQLMLQLIVAPLPTVMPPVEGRKLLSSQADKPSVAPLVTVKPPVNDRGCVRAT